MLQPVIKPFRHISPKGLIAFSVMLYLVHLFFIIWLAVDVPIHDEWNEFRPGKPDFFRPDVFWNFIFASHGQHYIVATRIITWVFYKLTNLDYSLIIIFNFVIYGIEIWLIFWIVKQYLGTLPAWLLIFVPLMLSARTYENHLMGAQNQFHIFLIFLLLSTYLLFNPRSRYPFRLIGALLTFVSIFSYAGGSASTVALIISFVCYSIIELRKSKKPLISRDCFMPLAPVMIMLFNVLLWAYLFPGNPSGMSNIASPWSPAFWDFFLNLISSAFGYHWVSWLWGLVLFLLISTPIIVNFRRLYGDNAEFSWVIVSVTLGICASLAMISIGRSRGAPVGLSKSSRYADIGQVLIPYAIAAWYLVLNDREKIFRPVTISFWIIWFVGSFGGIGYLDSQQGSLGTSGFRQALRSRGIKESVLGTARYSFWNYNRIYYEFGWQRSHGLECARMYYNSPGVFKSIKCLGLDMEPVNHKYQLDRAKELNLSFYQKIKAQLKAAEYYKEELRHYEYYENQ